jgi:hypothetical protein
VIASEGIAKRRGALVVTPDHAHRFEAAAFGQVPVARKSMIDS